MRYWRFFFLIIASNLVATPWQAPVWNNAGWNSLRQQQQWSREQQSWNQQVDQRVIERKQHKEHQKWECAQKKKQKV
jgi:hypothetical protein